MHHFAILSIFLEGDSIELVIVCQALFLAPGFESLDFYFAIENLVFWARSETAGYAIKC